MYGHGRDQGGERLGAVPKSVVGQGDDHQLSCSSNDGDVDVEKAIPVLVYFAFDFALAFVVQQRPSPHSCVSGWLGGTREPQYYEQIKDTATR
jgi:hypothetical protein